MKKTLAFVLVFGLIIALIAGCGKSNNGNNGNEKQPEPSQSEGGNEIVKVEFWHSLGGVNGKATDEMVAEFNQTVGKEKGIEVTSVFQGNDVVEKLNLVAQANDTKNFPDVGLVYSGGIPGVLKMSQLVPADDLYAAGDATVAKEDVEPNFRRAFTYQNKLISMPFNASTILLYYNKDMFKEAGLDPEAPPRTIAEMAEAIDKLKIVEAGKVKRYGLNVELRRYHMANWIGGQGEYNFFGDNEGGRADLMTKVTFGEDGTLEKFLTEWKKVVDTGGYKEKEDNVNEEFAAELFGMTVMSTARIQTIKDLTAGKFEFGVANLPKVDPADTGGTSVGGGSLAVFNRGDDKKVKAAWEFVQYAISPETQLTFHKRTGYIPVNKKIYDLPEMQEHLKQNPEYQVAIDQLHHSHVNVQEPFDIINWEIDEIIRTEMIEFAQGKQTISETNKAIVDQSNAKLSAYIRANR